VVAVEAVDTSGGAHITAVLAVVVVVDIIMLDHTAVKHHQTPQTY
jgi:hypothetical protein